VTLNLTDQLFNKEQQDSKSLSDQLFSGKTEASPQSLTDQMFVGGKQTNEPDRISVLEPYEKKNNLIEQAIGKINSWFGTDIQPQLSDRARAQAVVELLANENGKTTAEFRNSPEFIEQAASGFTNVVTLGVLPAIRSTLTGEEDFKPTDASGYIGNGLGSLAGLLVGPAKIVESITKPIVKFLPAASAEGSVISRVLKSALSEAAVLGPAIGLTATGEALEQPTFTQAAGKIYDATKSGAITGAVFGIARGMFPKEGAQQAARIITGLIGLNAQRALEVGGNPFTDRPAEEVMFDTALDVFFLWRGLPRKVSERRINQLDETINERIQIDKMQEMNNSVVDEPTKVKNQEIINEKKINLEQKTEELNNQISEDIAIKVESERQINKESPYFQDAEKTARYAKLFEGKEIDDPGVATQKLINDVNRWYHGEDVDITATQNTLSDLAGKASEIRNMFRSNSEFELWKSNVSEAAKWARGVDRLKIEQSEQQIAETSMDVNPIDAKNVSDYTKYASSVKSFKPMQALGMIKDAATKAFVDVANVRKSLLSHGEEGYRALQKFVLSKGASAEAANMLTQMRKEVYDGLNSKEKNILDTLILSDRMNEIARYKDPGKFNFPKGLEPKSTAAYSELFGKIEKLSPEKEAIIRSKAKAYYEWMKKPLKDMLDSGVISEQEFNDLSSYNYRKLKLVEIYDKQYQARLGNKKKTVFDSGVEALAKGRETDIFEPSSEIMALEVFNRSYGRVLNNKANQALLEIARINPTNDMVRIKNKDSIIPSGWNRIFVFEGGQRKAMYLSPEFSKGWLNGSPELSYRMSTLLRYASGSPVLRTMATGINWGFALANIPRDVMHAWFATSMYNNGKAVSPYNSNLPIYGLQIGKDIVDVAGDAWNRGPRYEQYIKEGGGMEFLVHQGRIFQRGRHIDSAIDKFMDYIGFFGETSELVTRLAIRERVIKQRAKEQGISVEEARKNKDITQEATFVARDYMDFGQGGSISKAIDNAVPYLNASIQGTRGLFRSLKEKPLEGTYKLAQFGALVTGVYLASKQLSPETTKELKGSMVNNNYLIIPLGDQFGFYDEQNQKRYPYFKIPIDPGQKFFKALFEASADKWLGDEDFDVDRVIKGFKEQSPIGVTEILPPTMSAAIGYITNKDFWMNEDIWRQTDKPFSWPQSKEEYIPGETPKAFIDIGEKTGLSPERLKYSVNELVTNGTVWSWLLNQGYEKTFGDLPKDKKEQHLAMTLSKLPLIKRFFGVTNPYSKHAEKIDEAGEADTLKRFINSREVDRLTDGYLYEGTNQRKDVFDFIRRVKDLDERKRLIDRFKYELAIKNLPEKSFWKRLKGLSPEVRAQLFVDRLDNANEKERQQLWKEYATVSKAGGVISEDFRKEVMRLRAK
jgi:hypothetical protein